MEKVESIGLVNGLDVDFGVSMHETHDHNPVVSGVHIMETLQLFCRELH
jgi:hypothetical protein